MALLRSIRVRLTLWYVLLLAVILAGFSAGVYLALRQRLYENLDDSLETRAAVLLEALDYQDGSPTLETDGQTTDPDEGEHFTRVYDSAGAPTFDDSAAAGRPQVDAAAVQSALQGSVTVLRVKSSEQRMRVRIVPVRRGGNVVGALEVGVSEEDVSDTLRTLLIIIAFGYPLALVVASGGGVFLAGRALSPIDRMTRVARKISAEDLSQRLDLHLADDEVGRLAQTFDEMIARLDEAFRRQRQFTADASHELRTPLTAIKGQTEVALQRDRDANAYREVLRAVNGEVDRMIRLVGGLLTLARADARQIPVNRETVELHRIVTDAVEQIRPAAADKGISINVRSDSGIRLIADQDLILQLVLNLLDNAVKHTPGGGRIEVSWRAAGDYAEVTFSDTGPGIPAEHLPHIFDRFYRANQARSRAEGGAGLGLSICRWIAEAHEGSIGAESIPGKGSTFTVRLPLS